MDLLRQKMESDFQSLRKTLDTLNDSMSNLSVGLQEHKEQTTAELAHLQTSLNSTQSSNAMQLNNKLEDMSSKTNAHHSIITEHQQQTTAKLAHLQTSLNSLNSKLDSLTTTAAQLSSDHQEIQSNISDVQCMDTQPSLQLHQNLHNNLTHQLKKIQDDVTFIRGPYTCGGTGGWRRVVYLDMTDPHYHLPLWLEYDWILQKDLWEEQYWISHTCSSATFPVSGGEYDSVCGRIKAYQWGQCCCIL